jgi:hypothetical protein
MPDAHIATKASFDFDGQTYTMSPITISDLKELEYYLRGLPLQIIQPQLAFMDPETRKYVLDRAYEDVQKSPIRIANDEFNAAIQTPDGALHLFYLALRHAHPHISKNVCGEMLQSSQREVITQKLLEVSGLGDGEKKRLDPATMA